MDVTESSDVTTCWTCSVDGRRIGLSASVAGSESFADEVDAQDADSDRKNLNLRSSNFLGGGVDEGGMKSPLSPEAFVSPSGEVESEREGISDVLIRNM